MINIKRVTSAFTRECMQLYNIAQTAEKLGVSKNTIRLLMDSGQLSYVKVTPGPRGALRFSDRDIDNFINSHNVDFTKVSKPVLRRATNT